MKSLILAIAIAAIGMPCLAAEAGPREAELLAQRKRAEQLRDEASAIRGEAETLYKREDDACLAKLLVNACRDAVRETYLAQIKEARDKEIEANRIDTAAKAELNKLREAERVKSHGSQSAPAGITTKPVAGAAKPASEKVQSSKPAAEPPPPLTAEQAAAFEAEKRQRKQEAEAARGREAEQAKQRAAKAKADRARYDARAKEIAERKAKRAEKAAASSPAATKP